MVLDHAFAPVLNTRHAVILTEHVYSREERYQVVVPIVGKPAEETAETDNVVRISWQSWFGVFADPAMTALFALPVIQSVWHHDDIVEVTPFVVDSASLQALEKRLCVMFGID